MCSLFFALLLPLFPHAHTDIVSRDAHASGSGSALAVARTPAGARIVPHQIRLDDGTTFSLSAPANYSIRVAAQGLRRLRFMAWSPDGRLFATDMHSLDDNEKGRVCVFDRFDSTTGAFGATTIYLDHLRNPNSIAFYRDREGIDWLYVALTDKLVRYRYAAGDTAPQGAPQTIATFPAYGLSYKYGGWHLTRTVATHADRIYVAVGSSCNACEEKEAVRASIIVMNPDGTGQRSYATGLRNSVGLKWVGERLWATDMGADHLGDRLPNDLLYLVRDGANYGWPYCYAKGRRSLPDRTEEWERSDFDCSKVPAPSGVFPAHSAPLGMEHFDESFADANLHGSMLVALHGSGKIRLRSGYQVVRVGTDGRVSPFITGFLQGTRRMGRPVDLLRRDARSFFLTDDFHGVLYYVAMR